MITCSRRLGRVAVSPLWSRPCGHLAAHGEDGLKTRLRREAERAELLAKDAMLHAAGDAAKAGVHS